MNHEYFEKWGELYDKVQKPMQAFAELNLKALQDLKNQNFEDFFKVKKPEDVIEFQLKAMVEQGKKTLDYWQKSFDIVQQSAKEFSKDIHVKKEKDK
ncbi:phasin family protein [Legionella sp. W05-934-2]|jgi:hypothetical protein|uniref:phasin family protein n=1 Tax=Legionella sp. W05-934-2 TaxID=1198649 RepID=UPI0034631329